MFCDIFIDFMRYTYVYLPILTDFITPVVVDIQITSTHLLWSIDCEYYILLQGILKVHIILNKFGLFKKN